MLCRNAEYIMERQNDCEIEKQEIGSWEWLERCLADVAMTKYNIINIMR